MVIFKKRIKNLIENLTKTHIYRNLPRGVDLSCDIKNFLPQYRATVIFDVGANIGQSAKKFLSWFPEAKIYCFEPVESTFCDLQKNLGNKEKICCLKLALGSIKAKGKMVLQGESDLFFLSSKNDELSQYDNTKIEDVNIESIDNFCSSRGIDNISFLKIDTEGHDLEVLKGANMMLSNNLIDLVEVEAGMNYLNRRHIPFEDLKHFLENKGYFLFGIYEQIYEWPTNKPYLRRANAVFISDKW